MKELAMAPNGLSGQLTVPGDKSISHRAVMLGALAKGETRIKHFLPGQDCLTTVKAFRDLGVRIDREGEKLVVYGQGLRGLNPANKALDMGNSGTTTRLLMGILAGSFFASQLIGDASLSKRPMKRVSQPLAKFGAEIALSPAGTLPATVKGQKLHGAEIQLEVASAQVKSAAIFAALAADSPSTIIEKLPTRNHTEIMLQQFGADIRTEADNLTIHVQPGQELTGQEVEVPGDMSSAAFWLTAGAIVPNSKVTLTRVNLNPTRTGIVKVLEQMGAKIAIEQVPSKGEELGNLTIETSQLVPVKLTAEDIPAVIDELPLVALLAACADGTSEIRGAEELRVKETDRIKTVSQELGKLGVEITELPDGMIIKGRKNWQVKDATLDSHGDHRLGMMAAIAALKSKQVLKLANEGSISVSYPGFFSDLEKLVR
ncbi:3-phosphoshikimate 1-carboxyvinyltransferase [Lactobacillus sp.]|uniref:3-phosphoshikimate 1-carboxyvinyltransferase n=1 Tax=Lactobacillus sp. TaxID=1591 RepID=UPI003F0449C5